MSRWGRGRGSSVAVPLDSALFRENSNCPSAARSAGTVGKWGITSFTSIRSAPYAYSSTVLKKPVQDQNSPLTVPAVESEQPPPRPKKFFKSRNAEIYPPVPQISYAPPVSHVPLSPEHSSHIREKKTTKRSRTYTRDSSSPELPRRNSEKTKTKKSTVATKAAKKEEVLAEDSQPPNKRYLVRNRDKVINYAEDGSNSPIPEFTRYESTLPKIIPQVSSPKAPSPKTSPLVASPPAVRTQEIGEIVSPSTSRDKAASEERKPPPIVLRISKGTSRIVSTDSNEGFTSPGSDRHSSMDTHLDFDHKKSPSMESICSPKHEGLKITIKCSGLNQDSKKDKKKDKKEHKSHKRHRKNSDDEPLKKPNNSLLSGSVAYNLHKTLEMSPHENGKNTKNITTSTDNIETKLAKLESTGAVIKSSRLEVQANEPLPEPKPPEISGRSRRNRPNINYSENDDYLDVLTTGYSGKHVTRTVSDIKKEGRKTRKRHDLPDDANCIVTSPKSEQGIESSEIPIERNDLIDILSDGVTKTVYDIKKETRKTRKKHEVPFDADSVVTSPKSERRVENSELPMEKNDLIDILSDDVGKKESRKTRKKHEMPADGNSPKSDCEFENNVLPIEQNQLLDILADGVTKTVGRKTRKKQELPPNVESIATSPKSDRRFEKNEFLTDKNDLLDILSDDVNKNISETKRESRKTRKKHEIPDDAASIVDTSKLELESDKHELPIEKKNLMDILSASSESGKNESHRIKLHRKHKHKYGKNSSPEHDLPPLKIIESGENTEDPSLANEECVRDVQELPNDIHNTQTNSQSSDSAYNSCPNENMEEDSQKNLYSDDFKTPTACVNDVTGEQLHIDDKPSVKLVITKKKGSIFKSKSLVNDNPSPLPARKRRHLYKHEWERGNETPRPEPAESVETNSQVGVVSEELTRVTRYNRSPVPVVIHADSAKTVKPYTSVRCPKEAKEYYTVVRNVKKAHQIQEIGEFQEFNDDVEYLLDALQNDNPISTRCLSAITLASKCTAPAFRMHLRAHGTVQKFFSALHDATNDQSLGLCTATVMFVLSQDRLNMDLDRESLELMLNLLESDVSHKNALDDCGLTSAQLTKTQERVRELCAEIKSQGKAQHLDLENITVGHLAMETLLSLTSKRAGEWFKEELRVLGGVDHIVRTIQDCASRLDSPVESWSSTDIEVLRKADRCLRVLENVTQQNEDNQLYLCGGGGGAARTICGVLRAWCGAARSTRGSLRQALLDAALPALKVLLNLSHSFNNTTSLGAQVIGEQLSVMETCLIILNNQGNFITDARNFEFSVCVLLLLINLVQHNDANTQRLLNLRIRIDNEDDIISRSVTALDLVVDLFYKREDLARRAEKNTDALLDSKPDNNDKKSQDDIDETVAKLLARAGAHMEHSMVGAYIALLLGHVGRAYADVVHVRVPRYAPLLPTLRKYYEFLALTASAEAAIVAHVKATQRIIEFMEASDAEQDAAYSNPPDDVPQDMSLNNMTNNYSYSSSDRSMELDGYH